MRLGDEGLGFDSLERLEIAAALSEALNMQHVGLDDRLLARPTFGGWCDVAARSLDSYSATITMRTSGSTGAPRPFTHQIARLLREVDSLIAVIGRHPGPGRIFTAVPSHHIYGFIFTVLLPHRLGDWAVLDVRDWSPSMLIDGLCPGDLVIGHPVWWQAIVRGASSKAWPAGVTGVTSTGPCPADAAEALLRLGLSRLLDIHGSTETAGLGWRDEPGKPYRLLPHWERSAPSSLCMAGGEDASELVTVPDALDWVDARHYRVAGRLDGAVQVGGTNVYPDRIAKILASHDLVRAASVRLMRDGEGRRLKAFIVPRERCADTTALRTALEVFAKQSLTTPEQPRCWAFGHELPTGPMGRSTDWPIAASA